MSPAAQRVALVLVAPPGGALRGAGGVADLGHRLVEAEGDVEEGGRVDGRAGAAGVRGVGGRLRQQVAVVGLVPQADAGREADDLAGRVPGGVRHAHLDLAAGACRPSTVGAGPRPARRSRRRRARRPCPCRAGCTVRNRSAGALTFAPAGNGCVVARRAADRDREGDQRGVLERVERDAERGRVGQRLARAARRSRRRCARRRSRSGTCRCRSASRRCRRCCAGRPGRAPGARRGRRRGSPGRGTRRRGTRPRRRRGSAAPSRRRRW